MTAPSRLGSTALNKHDPTPLYVQLSRILRRQIVTGRFRNGEAIPSETELQRLYQTTRSTVRQGISVLVGDGLVEQVQGKGTFVRLTPVNHSIWNFGSFTDYARSRFEAPVSLVVEKARVERSSELFLRLVRARGIATDTGTRFIHLDSSLLSLEMFPGLDEYDYGTESLYRVLREVYDVHPQRSELTVLAAVPDTTARRLLEIPVEVACVTRVEGLIYDSADRLIERTNVIYSPEQTLRLVTTIDPVPAEPVRRPAPGTTVPREPNGGAGLRAASAAVEGV